VYEIPANPLYGILIAVFSAAIVALLVDLLLFAILRRLLEHTNPVLVRSIKRRCRIIAGWLLFLIVIRLVMPVLTIPEGINDFAGHIISLFMIAVSILPNRITCGHARFTLSSKSLSK